MTEFFLIRGGGDGAWKNGDGGWCWLLWWYNGVSDGRMVVIVWWENSDSNSG